MLSIFAISFGDFADKATGGGRFRWKECTPFSYA